MKSDRFDDLIERISHHCQKVAQATIGREPMLESEDGSFNSYDIHELKTHITLKKNAEQELAFAFPPITEQQLQETEALLGCTLPPLLRLLYTRIANGGFGPGYGIIGAIGGYSLEDSGMGEDIAHGYLQSIQGYTLVNLQDYEMISKAQRYRQLKQLPPEQVLGWDKQPLTFSDKILHDNSGKSWWEQSSLYEFPHDVHPEWLLPLCGWGCGIGTNIDARTERIFQVSASDRAWHYIIEYKAASLEEWLERWLNGEMLQ